MDVDLSFQIVVLILAVMLAIFLALGIVALVKIIQILKHIKVIIAKAEAIANKAEAIGEFFKKSAAPVAIGRLLANIFEAVMNRKKAKRGKGDEEVD